MYVAARTLDDLLRDILQRLLKSRNHIDPSKGPATELTGVLLKLANPRARLSRTESKGTVFSCLGELLWYLAGTNELKFIQHYIPDYWRFSDDHKTVYGGYGPRLLGKNGWPNQLHNIIDLLKKRPESRQAVIQLFDAKDILRYHEDIPCTCTLQFMIRQHRLHMFTNMRSNDAFLGLPHDIFSFTMLQEIIARSIGIELGTYKHAVGSLHLYCANRDKAIQYVSEAVQPTLEISMPEMPRGDPWPSIFRQL